MLLPTATSKAHNQQAGTSWAAAIECQVAQGMRVVTVPAVFFAVHAIAAGGQVPLPLAGPPVPRLRAVVLCTPTGSGLRCFSIQHF